MALLFVFLMKDKHLIWEMLVTTSSFLNQMTITKQLSNHMFSLHGDKL